jgi:hypothetical protein
VFENRVLRKKLRRKNEEGTETEKTALRETSQLVPFVKYYCYQIKDEMGGNVARVKDL